MDLGRGTGSGPGPRGSKSRPAPRPLGPWHFQDSPRGSRDKSGHSGVENLKCQRPGCQRGPNTRAQPTESRLRDGHLGDLRTARPGVSASPLVSPLLSWPPSSSQFCASPFLGCWLATAPPLLRSLQRFAGVYRSSSNAFAGHSGLLSLALSTVQACHSFPPSLPLSFPPPPSSPFLSPPHPLHSLPSKI